LNSVAVPQIHQEFRTRYTRDFPRLHRLVQLRFEKLKFRRLLFQVFFLPFDSVQAFRDAFNEALS
jgi:hypothetical protein